MRQTPPSTRWFNLGAQALQRVRPDLPRGYGCPLCCRLILPEHLEAGHLSVEHAPLRSLQGRGIVLTCRACNSHAGATVDAAMRGCETIIDFAQGTMDQHARGRVELPGSVLNARILAQGTDVRVEGIPAANSPKAREIFERQLGAMTEAGSWEGVKFRLVLDLKGEPRDAYLGWLRSAYLVAFAALGYTYILHPSVRRVREQLQHPDQQILRVFSVTAAEAPQNRRQVLFITQPAWLGSLAIQMGRHTVFLPWLDDAIYERLAERTDQGKTFHEQLAGEEAAWPQQPVFALDFG